MEWISLYIYLKQIWRKRLKIRDSMSWLQAILRNRWPLWLIWTITYSKYQDIYSLLQLFQVVQCVQIQLMIRNNKNLVDKSNKKQTKKLNFVRQAQQIKFCKNDFRIKFYNTNIINLLVSDQVFVWDSLLQSLFLNYKLNFKMENLTKQTHWLPVSMQYQPTKELLERIQRKLAEDKEISKDKKQNYVRVIRQLNYTMGKLIPRFPGQVQKVVDNLRSILQEFQTTLIAVAKGSSFLCGSSASPKQLQSIFNRLVGYQRVFEVIRPFQDKQIRDDIVAKYEEEKQKIETSRKASRKQMNNSEVQPVIEKQIKFEPKIQTKEQKCRNCQLLLAVSLCPNGYIAKKLIKQMPDTQWISGILHEQGTVVDKDLQKAIQFYKLAYKKKNYQALYRLGSLNQRGLYGKPYQYLKMWEEASSNGHLQALTDMGYLYENGLQDDETGRKILQPNFDKAFSYYNKAAEKNFPRALNNLATFYFSNQKYKDETKCLRYLEEAAQAQYVKSLHNLGLIYYEGKLVKYDQKKSKNLIRRAAQKGDIQGRILYIQLMLNDANACTVDQLAELNRFCREIIAKDQQNTQAYYFLGIMHEQGYGTNKQPKNAFLYYTLAANMHNQSAMMKLAQCYKNGFGTQQDLRQAIRFYEQASKGNKQALVFLGQIYEKGGHDVTTNYQKAFDYYYQACNCGIPQAFNRLGNMYKYGRNVKKNEAKAEEYFQKGRSFQKQNNRKLASSSSDLIQSSYYRRR